MKRPGAPPGGLPNLPLAGPGNQPGDPLGVQDLLPFDSNRVGGVGEPPSTPSPERPGPATFGARSRAAVLDLAAIVCALLIGAGGAAALGARLDLAALPALAVFTASFSFLYTVMPLTFWGRTPGMAATGLIASSSDGTPLTIRQAVRRWLGGVLTLALCGLPLILMLTGRSLIDRVSDSRVSRR